MTSKSCLSLFAGGGGKTHGAIASGYTPIGAVDNNPQICDHYRQNIGAIECGSLLQIDPKEFDRPDLLMASPPCPSFSAAKVGATEGVMDLALANRIGHYIKKLKPRAILVENVPQYIGSQSYKELMADIENAGYNYDCQIFNAADFGVPQSRKRLFVRAVRSAKLRILPVVKTHCKSGDHLPRWRGWYSAIEDLILDMPISTLTDRQKNAIGDAQKSMLVQRTGYYKEPRAWGEDEQMGTLRASIGVDGKGNPRRKFMDIWLVSGSQRPDLRSSDRERLAIRASGKQRHRVVEGGECRSVNVPALVRLQGWPDGLQWSGDVRIDVRILGNSVPPPMAQKLIESMEAN